MSASFSSLMQVVSRRLQCVMQFVFGATTQRRESRSLIDSFFACLWSGRHIAMAEHLLADDFEFRSASDQEIVGRELFVKRLPYACPFTEWQYDVIDCVCEANCAFARVRVSRAGVGDGEGAITVTRIGAALFRLELETIDEEWALSDLEGADPIFHFARNRIKEVWVSEALAERLSSVGQ